MLKLEDNEYYWVQVFKGGEWEVGRYRASDNRMKFTDGGHKKASECYKIHPRLIERLKEI